jgi:hypothetical protein
MLSREHATGRTYAHPLFPAARTVEEDELELHALGELSVEIDRTPGVLDVRLRGRSSARDAAASLAPFFQGLLANARTEARVVALHFEALAYFNSSTIAALVQLIRDAQAAAVGLSVFYDPRQAWQAVSFDALRHALVAQGRAGTAVFIGEKTS